MGEELAIGIDLGTTFSCVGVYQNGKVEIIANDFGNRTTPSCVAFAEDEILVGETAVDQMVSNPKNTVYDSKRLIGHLFSDPSIKENIERWPFAVIEEDNKPKFKVEYMGKEETYYPEEISAMILTKMKETAETYIGETVTKAVITIPAHFNDSQRRATFDAGKRAGFTTLKLVTEPVAAAIAYGLSKKPNIVKKVLVYDLGGGTLDVSLLELGNGTFRVKSIAGNSYLGGQDFTNSMVSHYIADVLQKHGADLTKDKKALAKLYKACEKAKKFLSSKKDARIDIDYLFNAKDFSEVITRTKFEDLNYETFESTLECVEKVIRDARIDKSKIDDVLLIGGSTRIPCIQNILQKYFNGKKLSRSMNADEAVAYGAAIEATRFNSNEKNKVKDLILHEVIPLPLGVMVENNKMDIVINKNTPYPTKKTITYFTSVDNQIIIDIRVYEGESKNVKDNNFLGKFTLSGLKKLKAGECKILITFEVNADGILDITAQDEHTNTKNNISVCRENCISFQEVKRGTETNSQAEEKERVLIRDDLVKFCKQLEKNIVGKNLKGNISDAEKARVARRCKEMLQWLSDNQEAKKEEYESKEKEMNKLLEQCFHP